MAMAGLLAAAMLALGSSGMPAAAEDAPAEPHAEGSEPPIVRPIVVNSERKALTALGTGVGAALGIILVDVVTAGALLPPLGLPTGAAILSFVGGVLAEIPAALTAAPAAPAAAVPAAAPAVAATAAAPAAAAAPVAAAPAAAAAGHGAAAAAGGLAETLFALVGTIVSGVGGGYLGRALVEPDPDFIRLAE
jgi:hypothetical protein